MNRLSAESDASDRRSSIGLDRMPSQIFYTGRPNVFGGGEMIPPVPKPQDVSLLRLTQALRYLGDGLEDRRNVRGRTRNYVEHGADGGPLLARLVQFMTERADLRLENGDGGDRTALRSASAPRFCTCAA